MGATAPSREVLITRAVAPTTKRARYFEENPMHPLSLTTIAAVLVLAWPTGDAHADTEASPSAERMVIEMSPCKLARPVPMFFVSSSRNLVLRGTVTVGEETFSIYLPEDAQGYSTAPRPKRKGLLTAFTSTWLSVDQDHDGKISDWESYYAEHPLRIGDSMFDIESIAVDGTTITLIPSEARLTGGVIGRKAPDFEWTTTDGRTVRRDDFLGRTVVIDCWAPS